MNDLRHDPDAKPPIPSASYHPGAGWYLVPDGVKPWGGTTISLPQVDGTVTRWTNVPPPPPEPPAPDLRTVGDRVQALEAMTDRLVARCDALFSAIDRYGMLGQMRAQRTINEMVLADQEDRLQHVERVIHRLLNPGEQEGA